MSATKKILYLGGSITCGASATDYEKSWARLSFKKFATKLYGEDVEMLNASISGTGSRIGVFRLAEHVLPHHPDHVIIEFAVNDNGAAKKDFDMVVASMEYIVRALVEQNPKIAITFVYTTSNTGENAAHAHTLVAQHYGIPEIDLRAPFMEKINSGENVWTDFLRDAAHPIDAGHAFYADIVADAILADPERFKAPVKMAEPMAAFAYKNPRIVHPSEAVDLGGFVIQDVVDRKHLKRLPELVIHEGAVSTKIGDSLTFEFEGENFGVYHRIGNFGGRFSVSIDGKEYGTGECYHHYGNGTDPNGEHISRFYARSLSEGKHTAVVTVIEPNPDSKGTEVIIAGFFVG